MRLQCNLFSALVYIAVFSLITGCGKKPPKPSDKDDFNLVKNALRQRNAAIAKYNDILGLIELHKVVSEETDKEFQSTINQLEETLKQNNNIIGEHMINIKQMNLILALFSESVKAFLESGHPESYKSSKELFQKGKEQILQAENSLKALSDTIYYNPYISETEKQKKLQSIDDLKKMLNLKGVLLEHQMLWDSIKQESEPKPSKTETTVPENPPEGDKHIQLRAEEVTVSQLFFGGGIRQNAQGHIETLNTPDQIRAAAAAAGGFRSEAIDDALLMAQEMNGIMGMACVGNDKSDLIPVLNNIVGHMKKQANNNTDDLEISLALDYSGSMNNNIVSLIEGLSVFITSLQNVQASGRAVKIGIVTFNISDNSQIQSDIDSNLNNILTELEQLLDDYAANNRSMDPGEASYYGILKAKDLSWRSQNRQIIVITDEESYLLATGQIQKVEDIQNQMAGFNIYPVIVRLCD